MHRRQRRRASSTASSSRLGRRLPGPDQLPRLPLRRRAPARSSATPFHDIVDALQRGRATADAGRPDAAYTEANNLIKEHVPVVIVAHGGSGTAFKADVEGAHASPLGNEVFAVMKAGDRDTLVFDAERRAARPVLRRRDGRRDAPRLRADQRVAVRLRDRRHGPCRRWPTECAPNEDFTTWTCTLREGVTFHDGADARRERRRRVSYAVQWDAAAPAPHRPHRRVRVLPGLWGGFLNPPHRRTGPVRLAIRSPATGAPRPAAPLSSSTCIRHPERDDSVAVTASSSAGCSSPSRSCSGSSSSCSRSPGSSRAIRAGPPSASARPTRLRRLHRSLRPRPAAPGPVRHLPAAGRCTGDLGESIKHSRPVDRRS